MVGLQICFKVLFGNKYIFLDISTAVLKDNTEIACVVIIRTPICAVLYLLLPPLCLSAIFSPGMRRMDQGPSILPVDVLSEGLTPARHIKHAKYKKFISFNDLRIVLILISVLITEMTLYLPLNPAARLLTGTRRDGITAAVVSLHWLPGTVI